MCWILFILIFYMKKLLLHLITSVMFVLFVFILSVRVPCMFMVVLYSLCPCSMSVYGCLLFSLFTFHVCLWWPKYFSSRNLGDSFLLHITHLKGHKTLRIFRLLKQPALDTMKVLYNFLETKYQKFVLSIVCRICMLIAAFFQVIDFICQNFPFFGLLLLCINVVWK